MRHTYKWVGKLNVSTFVSMACGTRVDSLGISVRYAILADYRS